MTAATAIALDHLDLPALQSQPINNLACVKSEGLKASHVYVSPSSSSSLHPKDVAKGEAMSFEKNGGNKREQLPIDKINERELAGIFKDALIIDFEEKAAKYKYVARTAQASSEKTAENWYRGRTLPSLLYGLRLIAHSPSLQKEVMRLCALEAAISPDFQQELARLLQMMAAR